MVTQIVWNPNFLEDLVNFINPNYTENELKDVLKHIFNTSPTTYEKLQTLVDRIEFIDHLDLVKKKAKAEKYIFLGKEVKGIDWDIDALRLYLALTCVDILATNFEPFDKWFMKNCKDYDAPSDIQNYIKLKSEEYRSSFQSSSNFSRAFKNASSKVRDRICSNVAVIQGKKTKKELENIISYLYRIRNKYTHEGRRFHASPISVHRNQNIGPRDIETLKIESGFDLTESILQIAKEQANRTLIKYAEQID